MLGDPPRNAGSIRCDALDSTVRQVVDVVERRHVDDPAPREAQQQLVATSGTAFGLPVADEVGHGEHGLLTVADHRAVDEARDRLGVERRMAARDHERVALVTVDRMQRDAREVERGEHVGVAELGGEGEADKIERAERAVPVDGELRDPVRTHERLEIRPHGVRTLGERVVALVEDFVEDLHALVGHTHLVGVRVHERPVDGNGVPVLAHGVELAADVLDRLGHQGQQRLETREHRLDAHRWGLRARGAGSNRLGSLLMTRVAIEK